MGLLVFGCVWCCLALQRCFFSFPVFLLFGTHRPSSSSVLVVVVLAAVLRRVYSRPTSAAGPLPRGGFNWLRAQCMPYTRPLSTTISSSRSTSTSTLSDY